MFHSGCARLRSHPRCTGPPFLHVLAHTCLLSYCCYLFWSHKAVVSAWDELCHSYPSSEEVIGVGGGRMSGRGD